MFAKFKVILPGLLVAATGVGAGDLAGGAFAGSKLGIAVLWAVLVGAIFKLIITEGLTRWQLSTGTTLLNGAIKHLGLPVKIIFSIYLLIWSYFVGAALISATGVATHALFPVFDSAETGKIVFGIIFSLAALSVVMWTHFEAFEKIMGYLIGVMFLTVIVTAALMKPDFFEILKGTFIPNIPNYINNAGEEQGLQWTMALIGGVGGTLTILSYGYWIRESGRTSIKDLKVSRIDIITGYIVTAIFGMATVIIASSIDIDKQSSSKLLIVLSNQLETIIGFWGAKLFLVGAWAAIVSSLLGVWQSVPYLFADFWHMVFKSNEAPKDGLTKSTPYKIFLIALSLLPVIGLFSKFVLVQKIYAVFGAFVVPLIAITLLILNSRVKWAGTENRNKWYSQLVLVIIIMFFIILGLRNYF